MQKTERAWANHDQGKNSNEIISFHLSNDQNHIQISYENVEFQRLNDVLCARFSSNVMTTQKRKRYRRAVVEKFQPNTH